MSFEVKAPLIVVFTESGKSIFRKIILIAAITVSKYRPTATICAVSFEDAAIKALSYVRGVKTLRVPSFQGIENLVEFAIKTS